MLLLCLPVLFACEASSWGSDSSGQLGDGEAGGSRVTPGAATAGFRWLDLRAGWNHNCGIRADNSLWCWGSNNFGQLGDGTEDIDRPNPVQVGTAKDWITVAPGSQHTCGIRAGGQLWCWGRGDRGQLGNGGTAGSLVPVRVGTASDWQEITTGGFRYSCGIRGPGDLYCWGANSDGQLGVGDFSDRITPAIVAGSPWRGIDAGTRHTCAINVLDNGYCWGLNEDEQVSNREPANVSSPAQTTFIEIRQIVAGFAATCYTRRRPGEAGDRWATCIGDSGVKGTNVQGFPPVGCNSNSCSTDPNVRAFRQIDLTVDFACGVEQGTDRIWCWGAGENGQLGDAFFGDNLFPGQVLGNTQWSSVSVGSNHTVALEVPAE